MFQLMSENRSGHQSSMSRSKSAVDADSAGGRDFYRYSVYGISLRSEFPLALPALGESSLQDIELRLGSPALFSAALRSATFEPSPDGWRQYAFLRDGTTYVRWPDLAEFLVSADGLRLTCGLGPTSQEAFEVYLLGQALSFALVKRGFEPLHATTVVIKGRAVAFLGSSGFGKSSLAACFLEAGYPLLTDDLLLLQKNGRGFQGYPGPPRIKLFPKMARAFLKGNLGGVPMNSGTAKLVLPLFENQTYRATAPLHAIYVLNSPRSVYRKQKIIVESLSPREAFLALLRNTFNRTLVDPERLQRQFAAVTQLAAKVPMAKISYPRRLASLPEVRDAILSEI